MKCLKKDYLDRVKHVSKALPSLLLLPPPFLYPMESTPFLQRSKLCVRFTPEYILIVVYSF